MKRSPLTISLYVPNVADAVRFYAEIFGFEQTGIWEEEGLAVWAEVTRNSGAGAARIWFFSNQIETRKGPAFSGLIYLFIDDVDAEAQRLEGKTTIRWGPETMPYGLRELGVAAQPRALLNSVGGFELTEMRDPDVCCGFGGTFCVKYFDISNAIVEKKTANITASGAGLLLAGDLGCLMNMAGKLHRQGVETDVRHVAEVLAGMTDGPAIGEA